MLPLSHHTTRHKEGPGAPDQPARKHAALSEDGPWVLTVFALMPCIPPQWDADIQALVLELWSSAPQARAVARLLAADRPQTKPDV
jgi:hypothetical protein